MEKLVDSYMTVTWGMRGFFAVLIGKFEDENGKVTMEPIQSSPFSFPKREEAVKDAIFWAEGEGVRVEV